MKEQGLPTVMGIIQGLSTIDNKFRSPCKKACAEYFEGNIYNKARVLPSENDTDIAQIIRFMCEQAIVPLNWRKFRPYMMVDAVNWIADQNSPNSKFGTLQLSGYLRGNKLNPNNILHIVGYGDAQIINVTGGVDPFKIKPVHSKKGDMNLDTHQQQEITLLGQSDENIEPLERECPVDPFAAEQTWPSPEELQAAEKESNVQLKRVPKGTSKYQASWIPDIQGDDDEDEDDDDEEDSDGDEEGMEMDNGRKNKKKMDEDMKDNAMDAETKATEKALANPHYDSEDDFGDDFDETGSFAKVSMKRKKISTNDLAIEEKEYIEYPDEVESDLQARVRFRKYRGLKSFRTSPWDNKENLPADYSRIFQFENFRGTQNRLIEAHDGVEEGQYVTINVRNISNTQFAHHPSNRPLVVCGLHKFENKMSVVNITITRVPTYTTPIKSTQKVLAQVGFRRYDAFPIYSDISIKGDKFKVNKFLLSTAMATIFSPICFAPTPVIFFSEQADIMAIGSVSSVNPDRIMLKKIVLSGVPIRVGKTKAMVKDMFFNPDDVNWFKPVDLWTKYGKSGRIIESIGTHGHMKCVFDTCLTQQDTVMMSLYKRIYPKWVILPELDRPEPQVIQNTDSEFF
jgi:pre-rRNA-processing protein TSR1